MSKERPVINKNTIPYLISRTVCPQLYGCTSRFTFGWFIASILIGLRLSLLPQIQVLRSRPCESSSGCGQTELYETSLVCYLVLHTYGCRKHQLWNIVRISSHKSYLFAQLWPQVRVESINKSTCFFYRKLVFWAGILLRLSLFHLIDLFLLLNKVSLSFCDKL